MKDSFSTSEVAKYCHVTPDTIRKWAEAGRIKVFKTPGGHRRIRREDLLRFLRENRIPIHTDLSEPGSKVLIVDSDNATASVIQRFLERAQGSFFVETANDAFEFGNLMALFQPDVVFLDAGLPGVGVAGLCRKLTQNPEYTGTHIIGVTSQDTRHAAAELTEQGAHSVITKPFTPDDLRRALARAGVEVV